jgi:hypothetical protein
MNTFSRESFWPRWLTVVTFATAMAWVESAVVYYLRTHIDRIEPHQPQPLPIIGGLGPVELVREAATLVMLFTVGMLAAKTWRARFGLWDIFYYVFLKMMCGWPHSLLDWDILFLLPLPWWGPVLAPVMISVLMIFWGTTAALFENKPAATAPTWKAYALCFCGCVLALYTFMVDAIHARHGGVSAIRDVLPVTFNWPLFLIGYALMTAPAWRWRISPEMKTENKPETVPAEIQSS